MWANRLDHLDFATARGRKEVESCTGNKTHFFSQGALQEGEKGLSCLAFGKEGPEIWVNNTNAYWIWRYMILKLKAAGLAEMTRNVEVMGSSKPEPPGTSIRVHQSVDMTSLK